MLPVQIMLGASSPEMNLTESSRASLSRQKGKFAIVTKSLSNSVCQKQVMDRLLYSSKFFCFLFQKQFSEQTNIKNKICYNGHV